MTPSPVPRVMTTSRAVLGRFRVGERRSIRPGSWAIRSPSRTSCTTGNTHANRRSPLSAYCLALARVASPPAPPRSGRRRPLGVLPQVRWVAVVPAEVALVDGLDVAAGRAVVAVGVPGPLQPWRQLDQLGDLAAHIALVEQPQRLVVQVGVQVPLPGQELDDGLATPGWPVVGGEGDIALAGEQLDRLGQVPGPHPRIADLRPGGSGCCTGCGSRSRPGRAHPCRGAGSSSRPGPRCRVSSGTAGGRRR